MTSLSELLQQGTAHAWLFIPTALVLGALHGLEPGHSKTMMAAFIIAIRGTISQAVLLGLSAALSHTAIVWIVALGGQYLGRNIDAEASEPYFQLASGVIVAGVAVWMLWRTHRDIQASKAHDHGHHHDHHHDHGHDHPHDHDHPHGHSHAPARAEFQDAHELQHAGDIERRFAGSQVTTGQIVMFGLTGGLIPCPAAITVLLLCLQVKQLALGAVLVGSFSVGLAVTMVSVGVGASLAVHHISKRTSTLSDWARRAPYLSSALMLLVAAYMVYSGWSGLTR